MADNPLHGHKHFNLAYSAHMKVVLSVISLCFLMLFFVSCGQSQEGQSTNTGNNKQLSQSSHSEITYVAIGASDTFGIGTSEPYMENWPTDLSEKLRQRVHLINLGIPGITLYDALRLELPVAIDSHPQLVTIWLGVNDIADKVSTTSYSHDLEVLLSQLRSKAPAAQIMIANIPDLTLLPYFASYDQQELQRNIADYNQTIEQESQQNHAILVNMSQQNYNLKEHPEYISSDGLHPTDLGYAQIAELFYQTLEQSQK
jgi:acyl-CoA thioesterase I